MPIAKPKRQIKIISQKKQMAENSRYDRLFLAVAIFAFVAVGLMITAIRSDNLYRQQQDNQVVDATPLIFERHRDLSPDCGGDPLVTIPECKNE